MLMAAALHSIRSLLTRLTRSTSLFHVDALDTSATFRSHMADSLVSFACAMAALTLCSLFSSLISLRLMAMLVRSILLRSFSEFSCLVAVMASFSLSVFSIFSSLLLTSSQGSFTSWRLSMIFSENSGCPLTCNLCSLIFIFNVRCSRGSSLISSIFFCKFFSLLSPITLCGFSSSSVAFLTLRTEETRCLLSSKRALVFNLSKEGSTSSGLGPYAHDVSSS
mmetsp:Transcript_13611/g.47271  ORF Transcript_13611/g.47271 Transcript_13611/m.47271 type:complete len:222 (-) Transcript_13611:3595-4260(-)